MWLSYGPGSEQKLEPGAAYFLMVSQGLVQWGSLIGFIVIQAKEIKYFRLGKCKKLVKSTQLCLKLSFICLKKQTKPNQKKGKGFTKPSWLALNPCHPSVSNVDSEIMYHNTNMPRSWSERGGGRIFPGIQHLGGQTTNPNAKTGRNIISPKDICMCHVSCNKYSLWATRLSEKPLFKSDCQEPPV